MNKHPLSHTQHTAGQPNMKQEERKKRETKTTTSKVHMLLSPPPHFKRDHNGDKGRPYREKGNQEMRFAGKRKDTNPITCENPPPTNKGGTSDTAHVEEG